MLYELLIIPCNKMYSSIWLRLTLLILQRLERTTTYLKKARYIFGATSWVWNFVYIFFLSWISNRQVTPYYSSDTTKNVAIFEGEKNNNFKGYSKSGLRVLLYFLTSPEVQNIVRTTELSLFLCYIGLRNKIWNNCSFMGSLKISYSQNIGSLVVETFWYP